MSNSNRRTELEKEISIAQQRLNNAPKDTPEDVLNSWEKELDSLSFELNNLYDDSDNDSQ